MSIKCRKKIKEINLLWKYKEEKKRNNHGYRTKHVSHTHTYTMLAQFKHRKESTAIHIT